MTKTLFATFAIVACAALGCAFNPANLQNNGTGNGSGTGQRPSRGSPRSPSARPARRCRSPSAVRRRRSSTRVTGTVNGHSQDVTNQVGYSLSSQTIVSISSGGPGDHHGDERRRRHHHRHRQRHLGERDADRPVRVHRPRSGDGRAGRPHQLGNHLQHQPERHQPRRRSSSIRTTGCCSRPTSPGIEIHFTPGAQQHAVRGQLRRRRLDGERPSSAARSPQRDQRLHLPARSDALVGVGGLQRRPGAGPADGARDRRQRHARVGDSSAFHMQFAQDAIDGALYYWTTSGKTAIMRWDFGGSTTAASPT